VRAVGRRKRTALKPERGAIAERETKIKGNFPEIASALTSQENKGWRRKRCCCVVIACVCVLAVDLFVRATGIH